MFSKKLFQAVLISVFFILPSLVLAQDEYEKDSKCVRLLNDAQKTYEDGLIEKVEPLIRNCLNSGEYNKAEQLEAYKLIAMSKLYDDKEDEAQAAMIQFLKIDPEYVPQPGVDPKEFVELYSNYHTSPLYTLGIHLGLNFTDVNSYLERGTYNTETEKKVFSSKTGFQFGAKVSRYIYHGLNVNLDLMYAVNSYSFTQTTQNGALKIDATEDQSMLNVPLTLSYTFRPNYNLKPYIEAGIGMRYLFSASQTPIKEFTGEGNLVSGSSIDVLEKRNALMFEGVFGAGVKYKIPKGDVYLNFRYTLGLGNQRNESFTPDLKRDELINNYGITDNDFSINNMIVSIGYNYYLYKPRKKKAAAVNKQKEIKQEKAKKKKEPKKEKKSSESSEEGNKRRVIE